jgi:5-methylcytosine-specific restriction endonuclease McrA
MTKSGRGGSKARGRRSRSGGVPELPGEIDPDLPPGEFLPSVDAATLQREKAKARELRDSAWWKRKRSTGVCHYCGNTFPPTELTMDHVIPIVRGGRSVKENLVPCCKDCNSKKKYLLPTEWAEYLDGLK